MASRFKTYSVVYDFGGMDMSAGAQPVIKGLEYKAADGDLLLKVTVKGLHIAYRNYLQNDGKTSSACHFTLSGKADYGYELIDVRGQNLLAAFHKDGFIQDTPDFPNREALNAYVQGPYIPAKAKLLLDEVLANVAYDLAPHDFHVEMVVNTVEGAAPAYTEISTSANALTTLLTSSSADKVKLQPLIAVWEKHLAKVNWDDKKSEINKTVANALLNNLCVAYLLVEDYPKIVTLGRLFDSKNTGVFGKAAPSFRGDETYTGPSTSQVLKGMKNGQPIYYSKEEFLDFANAAVPQ
ncbi:hypothetical protein [Hymenobacter negativus]|uniref:Uncharacterized protein n=1 Tax=Hymenobacter negativus TaxID=2795026 RepID=A0ABS3QJE5_9BACT|nr:hypothetical protein [Hymenobacter negativus]MBO2011372.1 hypothetical protein [Hymenobacter negativus]